VEVGPGRGALTGPLLDRGLRVLAFEIDPVLAVSLNKEFRERTFFLVEEDALEADVAAELEEIDAHAPVPLVANLPYESATPMIRSFVRRPELFSRLVVMVQKEVADRVVAPPGGDAYGFLTVDVNAHARARRLFDVSPGSFRPPPQVHSSVIELVPHPSEPATGDALRIASVGFLQRRKTLVNALTPLWGREKARLAVEQAGLREDVRAETLALPQFHALVLLLGPPGR